MADTATRDQQTQSEAEDVQTRPGDLPTQASHRGQKADDWRGRVDSGRSRGTELNRSDSESQNGRTHIADVVVAKIAAYATREVPGVHSMGTGLTRRIGSLRAKVSGQNDEQLTDTQGVHVEVGERQAAVDLELVTYYGESIVEVTEAVRSNVVARVHDMTGLEVVEVNIDVDDIHVDEEESGGGREQPERSRVR
jgi:uncharacterized alkaline shock family protein YloU